MSQRASDSSGGGSFLDWQGDPSQNQYSTAQPSADLKKQKQALLKQIDAKGGKDKAPGLVKQLEALNNQIKSTPAAPANPTPTESSPASQQQRDTDAINRAKEIINVGEDYGRKLGNEFYSPGSLGRVEEAVTPEETAALEAAKAATASASTQSPQVAALIAQQQEILGQARELSPIELEALGVARGNLGGLDSQGMEAFRSAARQNIMGQSQADARSLAKAQARNQVTGSAATAQNRLLGQDRITATRNLERDLLIKNIDIKQAAQNAFTGLVTNTEANRGNRTNAASATLGSTITNDDATRKNATNAAVGNQGNIAGSIGARLAQLKEFNLNSAAAEKAGYLGSVLGGIGTITDQRGLLAGEDFADKQYEEQRTNQAQILDLIKQSLSKQRAALG